MTAVPEALTPALLVRAYCAGFFPMADARHGRIRWYSPDPRAVIPLAAFHVPRSLRRTVRRGRFEVRVNEAFGDVIRACADRAETWISDEIVRAYEALHTLGLAHSVETWRAGRLKGDCDAELMLGAPERGFIDTRYRRPDGLLERMQQWLLSQARPPTRWRTCALPPCRCAASWCRPTRTPSCTAAR
jgi:hypothetical protein